MKEIDLGVLIAETKERVEYSEGQTSTVRPSDREVAENDLRYFQDVLVVMEAVDRDN